jgi:hypothetical protein
MADVGRGDGLRTIFSFFLGLMLTTFIGVGVYTFHPPPDQYGDQITDLNRREEAIRHSRSDAELSPSDRDQIQEINSQRNALLDADVQLRRAWGRSTSIVLIVCATLAMAVSLVRAAQLPVISNGLLLGGVFTMLYGVGWIVATDTSIVRFAVMTVAFAITLALGYVRFVRRAASAGVAAPSAVSSAEGVADLERRVRDLEQRLADAAQALAQRRP